MPRSLAQSAYRDWHAAIYEVERKKNLDPLTQVLRGCVPAEIFPQLVELFSRYDLKFKPGNSKQIPSYGLSTAEVLMDMGCEHARWLVDKCGSTAEDAIKEAAEIYLISKDPKDEDAKKKAAEIENLLQEAYYGRRSSLRRMQAKQK